MINQTLPNFRIAKPVDQRIRVKLLHPVMHRHRVFDVIDVHPVDAQRLIEHVSAVALCVTGPGHDDRGPPVPMFRDARGGPLPVEVLDALEADDAAAVQSAMIKLLPPFLRPANHPEPERSE